MSIHVMSTRSSVMRELAYRLRVSQLPIPINSIALGTAHGGGDGAGEGMAAPSVRYDRVDVYPDTQVLVALDTGQDGGVTMAAAQSPRTLGIGTLRVRVLAPVQEPSLEGAPVPDGRVAWVDEWHLTAGYSVTQVGSAILKVAARWAFAQGCEILACHAPSSVSLLLQQLGFSLSERDGIWRVSRDGLRSSFLELAPTALSHILGDTICSRVLLQPGEKLFERGQEALSAYVVVRGSVTLNSRAPGRAAELVRRVGNWEVVGEEAGFRSSTQYVFEAQAEHGGADVWRLDRTLLERRLREDAGLRDLLQKTLGERIQALTSRDTERSLALIAQGIYEILLDQSGRQLAMSKVLSEFNQVGWPECNLSWLYAQVGASSEPVLRVLRWMESHGAVRMHQDKVQVVDMMRLRHLDISVLLNSPLAGMEAIPVWQQGGPNQAVG